MIERVLFQLVMVFALWASGAQAQTTFDPVGMTEHIAHGDFEHLCGDTVLWIVEKPGDRWISQYVDQSRASRKFRRVAREHELTLLEWYEPDHFFVVGVGCQGGKCLNRLRIIVGPSNLILSVEVLRCVE
jgi:hypothetical protein